MVLAEGIKNKVIRGLNDTILGDTIAILVLGFYSIFCILSSLNDFSINKVIPLLIGLGCLLIVILSIKELIHCRTLKVRIIKNEYTLFQDIITKKEQRNLGRFRKMYISSKEKSVQFDGYLFFNVNVDDVVNCILIDDWVFIYSKS